MDIIITILLGSFKFAMTFPLAVIEFKFGFFETILWINIGGILGIYFFAYLSEAVNNWLQRKVNAWKAKKKTDTTSKKKKIFTKRNRRLIRIKQQYGLIGIVATTPILLSIPVGVFLVVRYYPSIKSRFLYLIMANIVWSFIFTSFYMFWNDLLFSG